MTTFVGQTFQMNQLISIKQVVELLAGRLGKLISGLRLS